MAYVSTEWRTSRDVPGGSLLTGTAGLRVRIQSDSQTLLGLESAVGPC